MAVIQMYNREGESVGTIELDKKLFDVAINPSLVHQAVVAQTANSRQVLAHTKNRGEVAGSSKRPWKQKGTGRARQGSTKSPIWIGGGITFGPRSDRNFTLKINEKSRRRALAMVLSDKVSQQHFIVMDELKLKDGKTKELSSILKKLPTFKRKTLIVLPPEQKDVAHAARNLSRIKTLPSNCLNIVDLMKMEYILTSKEAVEKISQMYKQRS